MTMKVYEAINKVAAAMSAAGITKSGRNAQQGYNFRGIDSVLNTLSGVLTTAGLIVLPRVAERECTERTTKSGGAMFYVALKVDFDLVSVEDGSRHTVTTYGEAMDSADKATNKAMSAAYKYMALLTFCIPTEGVHEDADATTPEPSTRGTAPPLMNPDTVATIVAGIGKADSLSLLREAFDAAVALAREAQDGAAVQQFIAAKDARKATLDAAAKSGAAK